MRRALERNHHSHAFTLGGNRPRETVREGIIREENPFCAREDGHTTDPGGWWPPPTVLFTFSSALRVGGWLTICSTHTHTHANARAISVGGHPPHVLLFLCSQSGAGLPIPMRPKLGWWPPPPVVFFCWKEGGGGLDWWPPPTVLLFFIVYKEVWVCLPSPMPMPVPMPGCCAVGDPLLSFFISLGGGQARPRSVATSPALLFFFGLEGDAS